MLNIYILYEAVKVDVRPKVWVFFFIIVLARVEDNPNHYFLLRILPQLVIFSLTSCPNWYQAVG